MITSGFGMSVVLGDDGQLRTRQWYVRADGVKRWADNDQPCEPKCAIDGVLHDGQVLCGYGLFGSRCNSDQSCEHQREPE